MLTVSPDLRMAWRGRSLLLTDMRGECGVDNPMTGFYHREARHLSLLRLLLDGKPPRLCEIGSSRPTRLEIVFNYPPLEQFGGGGSGQSGGESSATAQGIEHRSIDARMVLVVHAGGLRIDLIIANRGAKRAELGARIEMFADFADIQDALANKRPEYESKRAGRDGEIGTLRFECEEPRLPLATTITVAGPSSWSSHDQGMSTHLMLAPGEEMRFKFDVRPTDQDRALSPEEIAQRERRLREWLRSATRVQIPLNRTAQHAIMQSARDLASLALLEGDESEWLATQAGLPLYPALFGRDALTAGWQAGMMDNCEILNASLTALARLQGTRVDPGRDEEPGRIIQQQRSGPIVRMGKHPFDRYYGDYASPLMFVISLANRYAWRGITRELDGHWDAARRVMDWAREYGDADGDGYLEYSTSYPEGPQNQGWKDSGDAMVYEDGTTMKTPLADCEVQGYWFAAQQLMAAMCLAKGKLGDARAYWKSAAALKKRFNRDWWVPEENYLGLAMGPDKRLSRSIASNAGHCLATGIVDDEHIPALVERMFAPDMFSGWGIRTLSTQHPRYNPLSYHRGSIWLVENATIAFGLRRFGFDERALELASAMFSLAQLYENHRVPETIGGYARSEHFFPGAYPRANTLQAWNASAMPLLLHTILGLQPIARLELLVADPVLPAWMPEVRVKGLRVGGATADLRFWRDKRGRSHVRPVRVNGTLHVVRQPPPESMTVGWGERVRRFVRR